MVPCVSKRCPTFGHVCLWLIWAGLFMTHFSTGTSLITSLMTSRIWISTWGWVASTCECVYMCACMYVYIDKCMYTHIAYICRLVLVALELHVGICIHTHIRIHVYIKAYTCTLTWACPASSCLHTALLSGVSLSLSLSLSSPCADTDICMHTNITRAHKYMEEYTYKYMYICIWYMNIYIYIYMYIHTHTHTLTWSMPQSLCTVNFSHRHMKTYAYTYISSQKYTLESTHTQKKINAPWFGGAGPQLSAQRSSWTPSQPLVGAGHRTVLFWATQEVCRIWEYVGRTARGEPPLRVNVAS